MTQLTFALDVDEGWPPVAVEAIPVRVADGGFEILVAPLFVGGMSVGDKIEVETDPVNGTVMSWRTIVRSGRSTIWLLRLRQSEAMAPVIAELRALGCETSELEMFGACSVDVPESLAIEAVDQALAKLDSGVAVAFPSLRHMARIGA